jgi:hypothetical protein
MHTFKGARTCYLEVACFGLGHHLLHASQVAAANGVCMCYVCILCACIPMCVCACVCVSE